MHILLPVIRSIWHPNSLSSRDFMWLEAKCSSPEGALRFRWATQSDLRVLRGSPPIPPQHSSQTPPRVQAGEMSSASSLSSHSMRPVPGGHQHSTQQLSHGDEVSQEISFDLVEVCELLKLLLLARLGCRYLQPTTRAAAR